MTTSGNQKSDGKSTFFSPTFKSGAEFTVRPYRISSVTPVMAQCCDVRTIAPRTSAPQTYAPPGQTPARTRAPWFSDHPGQSPSPSKAAGRSQCLTYLGVPLRLSPWASITQQLWRSPLLIFHPHSLLSFYPPYSSDLPLIPSHHGRSDPF